MLKRALIFAIVAAFGFGMSARADTACEMVDQVLETVSVVQDIELDISDKYFGANIQKLDTLAEEISLAVLIPQDKAQSFAAEQKVMFQYLSTIREAAAGGASGHNHYAKETLNIGMTTEFSRSLQSLGQYWDCQPGTDTPENQTNDLAELAKKSRGKNAAKEKRAGESEKPGPRAFDPSERLNNRVMQKARFDGGAVFEGDTLMFLLMMASIAIGLVFYFVQKRAKVFQERDARKLLHKPVKVRIGKTNFEMNVVDISMSGVKISHPGLIDKEGKISLLLDGTWHAGQIKWFNDLFAGVKFKKPIDAQTVAFAVKD